MLRKEIKWSYTKFSIKTHKKAEKAWKIKTKNKGNKQKTILNMVNIDKDIAIIILMFKGLTLIKRQTVRVGYKEDPDICI